MSLSKYSNRAYIRSGESSREFTTSGKPDVKKRINLEEVLKEAELEAKKDSKVMEPDDVDFWDLVQETFRQQRKEGDSDDDDDEISERKGMKMSMTSYPKGTKLKVREQGTIRSSKSHIRHDRFVRFWIRSGLTTSTSRPSLCYSCMFTQVAHEEKGISSSC